MFSLTQDGLQTLLHRLPVEEYCKRWKLCVNVPKTKVVVFDIACVCPMYLPLTTFCTQIYRDLLSVCVNSNMSVCGFISHGCAALMQRSPKFFLSVGGPCMPRHAWVVCVVSVRSLHVSLSVSLFNAYVRPVIMYCLDALPLTKKQEKQLDDLQLQYIRWCLGLAN